MQFNFKDLLINIVKYLINKFKIKNILFLLI